MVYLAIILSVLNTAGLVYFVFLRGQRSLSQGEETKLSKGLQILQSKIAVLEDLSDQVDNQVKQISQLLEGKYRELQSHLSSADHRMQEIQGHLQRSQEVSKLFRDKIPHEEMIQRKNTVKYVKAAKMANGGANLEEIAQAVDLPMSELEMIAKVNKNGLMFNDQALPGWIQDDLQDGVSTPTQGMDASSFFLKPTNLEINPKAEAAPEEKRALKQLGEQFKKATTEATKSSGKAEPVVRPFEFKKINGNFLE